MQWISLYSVGTIIATKGPHSYYSIESLHDDELAAENSARAAMRKILSDYRKDGGIFVQVHPKRPENVKEWDYAQGDRVHRVVLARMSVPLALWVMLRKGKVPKTSSISGIGTRRQTFPQKDH